MLGVNVRLIAYGLAAAAVLGLGWQVNNWRQRSNELTAVTATLTQERAEYAERDRLRTASDAITNRIGTARENAIQDLNAQLTDARNSIPRVSLRKCPSVPTAAPSGPASGIANGPRTDGPDRADEGADIGPALLEIAGEAAMCGNALNLLQQYTREQSLLMAAP